MRGMEKEQIMPGDFAPWFDAQTLAGTNHNLGVLGGRWVVLYFVKSLNDAPSVQLLAEIIATLGRFFNDDHVVFLAVIAERPSQGTDQFAQASHKGLGFMMDYDGKIAASFGVAGISQLVVLDPLLRVEKIMSVDGAITSEQIRDYISGLPQIDDSAGVPLTAPALIIPRVFEPEFCAYLIGLYDTNGGKDSGFMLDKDGKSMTVIDHKLKQRRDLVIDSPDVREQIRTRIVRRMVPAIERFFHYLPTRMDRYLVSCYDFEVGGHFSRHRDNVNAGAQHRQFAASFNLNCDYDGCDLIFPEFGRRLYRAPQGGAIVFSTGALHQVMPITRGKRYAFVPFFYGEEEARKRTENNARLHQGEGIYTGENDRLFP
jgi:predicted 2-oxoglutarate/Fe(II)-dependent dioxygenase YbiX/peroxiredoxin